MKVILASNSPRRRELLKEIFEDFEVMPQKVMELCGLTKPAALVTYLAKIKLGRLPSLYPDALIISADTVVFKDGNIYGKPKDEKQAKKFLDDLSGEEHCVYTGVAIYYDGKITAFYDRSSVKFKLLTERQKLDYIATKSPMDKAGAYGIQDEEVVDSYKGSYTNIVGLPMEKLKEKLNGILQKERI